MTIKYYCFIKRVSNSAETGYSFYITKFIHHGDYVLSDSYNECVDPYNECVDPYNESVVYTSYIIRNRQSAKRVGEHVSDWLNRLEQKCIFDNNIAKLKLSLKMLEKKQCQ